MSDRCPTCGCPVNVISGDEGTSYYEPVVKATIDHLHGKIARLEGNVTSLVRELDREREVMPSEGIFLVEHNKGGKAYMRIAKLGELPDPVAFAPFARHTDAIAAAIIDVWKGHDATWGASAMDIAEGIVKRLAREEGVL